MEGLAPVAGLIAVGAIAPGPNNLVVMRLAAGRAPWALARAVAGIVLGGLAVLGLAGAGFASLLSPAPAIRIAFGAAVGVYLGWLGVRMISGGLGGSRAEAARLPVGAASLFAFQLVQPGPWLLAAAALSGLGSAADAGFAPVVLAGLFVCIPTLCLTLWSVAGVAIAKWMERRSTRAWFDRILGALLLAFSVGLVLRAITTILEEYSS